MLENIKLDIVYYNTKKDFEMEFNLCGCCRMRLLTAEVDNLKDFANCIKVAVARSRVVLLCGELYGKTGLLNIISKAVGRDFEEVENSLYGIAGDGKTSLLKQSIPLVTSGGQLLGCVIEQGPQAIIMISNNKDGRREIMQNLVHPYIKEKNKFESNIATNSVLESSEIEPEILSSSKAETFKAPCETEAQISETITETDTEEVETEHSLYNTDESEAELETVSLENIAAQNEANTFVEDTTADDTDEDATENDTVLPSSSDLVFAEGEDNETVFTADVFKKYNETFSLINPANNRNGYKNGRNRGNSPIILILFCLVLCLLGVIIYFLLVKPAQADIDIVENFNNLFSFALKGVNRPW